MKMTFPDVPPGRDIADEAARDAAIVVRAWYEGGDDARVETGAIVTVVRWAIHKTRAEPASEPAPSVPTPAFVAVESADALFDDIYRRVDAQERASAPTDPQAAELLRLTRVALLDANEAIWLRAKQPRRD